MRRIREKDSFSRNAFTVFSGNSVMLLSQLILTPLIARIYGPEAYGIYGLVMALVMNLYAFADLGYSNAYVLPKEPGDFFHLLRLNLALLMAVALAALVAALAREGIYQALPSWSAMGDLFLLVPLILVAYGSVQFATMWLTRERAFRRSVMIGSASQIGLRAFNLVYGLITKGALHGLVLGELVSGWASLIAYRVALSRHGWRHVLTGWSLAGIKRLAIEYRRFPLLTFPERWVSQLGMQLPVFLLIGDPAVVGHFALSGALLLIPLRVFGYSFSTVYVQKAAETVESDPELLGRITKGLYQRLFWFGLIPFTLLVYFSDEAFRLILGEEWHDAGVITAYMGLFFYFRLLSEPMVTLFYAQRREHLLLVFQSVLTAARLIALVALMRIDAASAILGFSLVSAIGYLVLGHLILHGVGQPALRLTLRTLAITTAACGALAALRMAVLGSWFPSL